MLRILWISLFFLSHHTLPSCSAPPEGRDILARLQSAQYLTFALSRAEKQSICRCFAIWIFRLPHHTVPAEVFSPPGFLSCPYLQEAQVLLMATYSIKK